MKLTHTGFDNRCREHRTDRLSDQTTRGENIFQHHRARGFTLIELLLVMVILVVLAAVVVPKFTNRSEQARLTAARTDITSLETAIDAFEIDNGRYPSNDEALGALVTQPNGLANWHGPYIKRAVNADPWQNPYVYRAPGTHNTTSYDLYSMGPDGREGTDDVTNWNDSTGK